MSTIAPGTEWTLRELADTADEFAKTAQPGVGFVLAIQDSAYAQGVADTLRFLVGDTPPIATLAKIYALYEEGI